MSLSDKMPKKQRIPIGVDDYKFMIEGNYLHIDKTLLIKEFWDKGALVTLITRPRRFGKSMNLSMIKYFFEKTEKSTTHLFENTLVWQEEGFQSLQGTYPVIFISFKDIKAPTWEQAYQEIQELLIQEIVRTLEPIEEKMSAHYKAKYQALLNKTANEAEFSRALLFITEVLKKHMDKSTIILI